jgi:hypothetical protein
MEAVVYVLMAAAYIAALVAYLTVAPFVAGCRALIMIGQLTLDQGRVLRGVLRRRTPEFQVIAPYRPQDEPQPAYRQYFYGPAQRDLRQLCLLGWRRYRRMALDAYRFVSFRYFSEPAYPQLVSYPLGLTMLVGLTAGLLLDIPLIALALLLYVLGLGLLLGLAHTTAGTLRAVDRAVLRAKDLHKGMICPHCYEKVRYPRYECSGTGCHRLHTDIRLARYGILKRRCACGTKLPTLIITGAHRLQAVCTFCEEPMSAGTGRVAETVLPMIGGPSAGKTQLMAAVLMTLESAAQSGGPAVSFADADTRRQYEYLREVLNIKGHTRGTTRELPRSHSLLLGSGRTQRLVHIFDTAGERFTNREDADALRYARAARTFVFVLDPLSVAAFWNGLLPDQQASLDRSTASSVPPQLVFQQTVRTMIEMGAALPQSRLAVAVSKSDLLSDERLLDDLPADDSAAVAAWLERELGLGNLVRSMSHEFREVRFFRTAAVATGPQQVHPSVGPLVEWCLGPSPAR